MKILYMIDTNIILGVFLIILNFYTTKFLAKKTAFIKTLSLASYFTAICLFSESIYVFSLNNLANDNSYFGLLLTMYIVCSVFGMLGSCFWGLFIKLYIAKEYTFSIKKVLLFSLPAIIGSLLIITSPLTGLVFKTENFTINPVGILKNTELFIIILYNIYCVITIANNTHKISALEYSLLVFLETIPLIGLIVNSLNSGIMSSYYLFTLTLIICYITLQDNLMYYDTLTNGLTRKSFDTLIYSNNKKNLKEYSIVYLELNNYSTFNNKEFSLQKFSNILESILNDNNKFAYFNNNEFVIYIESVDKTYVQKIINSILKKTENFNLICKNKNENLDFTYGYSIYSGNNSNDLLKEAYVNMYNKKIDKKDVVI